MGLKELICGALAGAEGMLGCIPGDERTICKAIDAAQAALDCDSQGPGQGCSVTGCNPGYYCDTLQDVCLLQKGNNEPCLSNNECVSGFCDESGFCSTL